MEIYKDLSNPASKEFEKLLNSQLSKTSIEEGKIIEGKINKITEKFVFLFVEGLKSEPVVDINELKSMGLNEKIKVGEKISVLLERIEDKNGDVIVSASKAQKIKGWDKLVEAYEKKEPIMGKITSKCKGGCIVEHIETGSLMFLPGSQISDKPLKDISHLMGEPQKFALIKLDKVRGNACVSRREIISSFKKEDKAKIIEKYKVGDIIKNAEVKGYSNFGCFFNVNSELDVLVHLQEISYSRVNHPDEVFNIGEKHDLKVISVDKEKLQVGCSVKQLSPDPFEHIENYELNKIYKAKVVKIMDFGAFCELEPGLTTLLHSSELSWSKKNASAKKMFKVGDEINCVITEINKEKRRVAISHKLTEENPFELFEKKFPVGTIIEGQIVSKNEYSLFVKIQDLDVDAFLHCNDLTYLNNGEDELAKYKKVNVIGGAGIADVSMSPYFFTNFVKDKIVCNYTIAKLPRWLVYPIIRWGLYLEYLAQKYYFKEDHNIHTQANKKATPEMRIKPEDVDPLKTTQKERSLRTIVNKKMAQIKQTEEQKTISMLTAGP